MSTSSDLGCRKSGKCTSGCISKERLYALLSNMMAILQDQNQSNSRTKKVLTQYIRCISKKRATDQPYFSFAFLHMPEGGPRSTRLLVYHETVCGEVKPSINDYTKYAIGANFWLDLPGNIPRSLTFRTTTLSHQEAFTGESKVDNVVSERIGPSLAANANLQNVVGSRLLGKSYNALGIPGNIPDFREDYPGYGVAYET